ncbi:hypothetical protein [Neisseria zoodegmatis]|nr:hypothetical protein [Neisseria zoodegmatis]
MRYFSSFIFRRLEALGGKSGMFEDDWACRINKKRLPVKAA